MITVAFVTYLFRDQVRRAGPMPLEAAEAFAKDVSRRPEVSGTRLEKWACVDAKEYLGKSA